MSKMESLLKDHQALQAHKQMVVLDGKNKSCSGYKEQRIFDSKLKLVREFLRMVEVAEAEAERHRRTEHFFFELQKYFVEQML